MNTSDEDDSRPARAYSVALTGGIASGKSTVAEAFQMRGVPIFDADLIARDLVSRGSPALAEIAQTFGSSVLDVAGELDRRRMREIVFADAGERRRLEAILHPRVRAELVATAQDCRSPYCVLMIPLLTESHGDYTWIDRVLVIDVPLDVQIARVMRRDAISNEAARRILAVQASREQRLALADDVIDNTGSIDALNAAVRRLHERYLRLSHSVNATARLR